MQQADAGQRLDETCGPSASRQGLPAQSFNQRAPTRLIPSRASFAPNMVKSWDAAASRLAGLASTTRKLTARPFSAPVMRNLSLQQPHCMDQVGRQAHTTSFFPRVNRRQDLASISVSSSEIGFDDIHNLYTTSIALSFSDVASRRLDNVPRMYILRPPA